MARRRAPPPPPVPEPREARPICRVAVIEPLHQRVFYKTVPDDDISRAAGGITLPVHSVLHHGPTMSYGLFSNATLVAPTPEYFVLGSQLQHGPAVLYAFDKEGRTIDVIPRIHPKPRWLGDVESARDALQSGQVNKPEGWEC